ncbi:hypothetical protein NPIL_86541 [Nephila pilipes]|uniref:Uncharacterized protein n=2 Tax=Nephila pilipes TaxID=299642 RepID=A0A8X6PV33_NEPPI|nr:hypothetical protein NPIL_86541 [Nephila pilipes]
MSQETLQSSSFSNFGLLKNEDISFQMGHLSKSLNYSGFESNQNAFFNEEQSNMFPNHPESMSNETSTHFKQRECSVYNLGVISSEIYESNMEQSNSGIYYPKTFSNETILQYVQQSSLPLNCPESISNKPFNHFTQQQMYVHIPITTSGERFSYCREQSNSYLDYHGQMYNENNSNSMQQSISLLQDRVLKSSESIANEMQPTLNYVGSIPHESFTHFPQRKHLVYNPVDKIKSSIFHGEEKSNSYWNYPGSMSRENNSSPMQHSISSLPTPVSNSTECASYNIPVIPGQSCNLGAHTKKNISSDNKNSNSFFSNLEYNLTGCIMSPDMHDLSSNFSYHEAPLNDVIPFENHQTHSASVYPETASRVYKTNDMLNSHSSSSYPRTLTLKSSPFGNEQSNGSLFYPRFTSTDTASSNEQYSKPISNTSSLNSGEYISCNVRNTISVSENPRSMNLESISRNMENTTSSSCILGPHSNTEKSFNLEQSNSALYHLDSNLLDIDFRDMQTSSAPIYSRELHKNVNKFLETQNLRTSNLSIASTLNKSSTIDSSQISHTYNYDNIPINKVLDKSNENNTSFHDFNKNNDKIPETRLSERNKFELIQKENASRQSISSERNIYKSKNKENVFNQGEWSLEISVHNRLMAEIHFHRIIGVDFHASKDT